MSITLLIKTYLGVGNTPFLYKKRYLNQKYLSYKLITNIFNYLESPIAPWSAGAILIPPSLCMEPSVTTRIGN